MAFGFFVRKFTLLNLNDMVMLKLDELVKGENYIHVDGFDGRKTEFRYKGKTDRFRHSITIIGGREDGVVSFLIPTDQIFEK